MELSELVQQVEGFDALPPREKIRLFAWFLHTHKRKDSFDNAAVRACYDELHLTDPNHPPSTYPGWRTLSRLTL